MNSIHPRPAVLGLAPQRLASELHPLGIKPHLLTYQPAARQPERGRWQLLPALRTPLLIDCRLQGVITTAMLLNDLQREQRTIAPCFIVAHRDLAIQRLLALSNLRGVVFAGELPIDTLSQWLTGSIEPLKDLVWVGLEPPAMPLQGTHLVPLLAALAHAESVPQAAYWCNLSPRRAYEILATSANALRLPRHARRQARQWAGAFNRALGSRQPQQETIMENNSLEIIAATLCGCIIERIHITGTTITFTLDEPRQGCLTLTCTDAVLLNAPDEYADFSERSAWERRIDWADLAAEDVIAIYLADETHLLLRLRGGGVVEASKVLA
jgi:hypothetical protein